MFLHIFGYFPPWDANCSEAMKIAVYPTGDPHFLMAMLMWKMSSVFKNPPSFHHTGWFIRIPKFPDRIVIFPIEILYNHRTHQQDSGHCCLSKPSQFGPVENFSASSAPSISILVMSSTHILKRGCSGIRGAASTVMNVPESNRFEMMFL